jgi:hypothetical protein
MKGVLFRAAMRRGVHQRVDHMPNFQNGARPAMRQQQGHASWCSDMQEVDIDTVNLGHALPQRIQQALAPPPIIGGLPMLHQGLDLGERRALPAIFIRLQIWPACPLEPVL